jgi:hypothetical protein
MLRLSSRPARAWGLVDRRASARPTCLSLGKSSPRVLGGSGRAARPAGPAAFRRALLQGEERGERHRPDEERELDRGLHRGPRAHLPPLFLSLRIRERRLSEHHAAVRASHRDVIPLVIPLVGSRGEIRRLALEPEIQVPGFHGVIQRIGSEEPVQHDRQADQQVAGHSVQPPARLLDDGEGERNREHWPRRRLDQRSAWTVLLWYCEPGDRPHRGPTATAPRGGAAKCDPLPPARISIR